MLYGAGQIFVLSKELGADTLRGENLVHPLLISSFSLTFEDSNIEAKALINGKRQIVGAAIAESTATLTLTMEYQDFQSIQFAYDELASTSTNVTLPVMKSKTATQGTGVAEVTDADIAGTEEVGKDILAYVASKGSWGDRKYLTASDVTVAAGKFTIDEAYVGAVIQYTVPKTYSSIETIGVSETNDQFGKLSFQGVVAGTEFGQSGMGIIIPEIYRISTPELTVNGDLTEMTVEFRAAVPVGQRTPYQLYKLEGATTV